MNRYDAWLSGINIRDCDPRIVIDAVDENTPKEKSNITYMGYTHGGRLTNTLRQSLSVGISIGIKETDTRERDAVYQSIRKWGRYAGYLTTSLREGQRLYVEKMEIKTNGKKWAEIATLMLTAYAKPFWEEISARSVSIAETASGSATLSTPGNADECIVDAEITAKGGTLNTISITVGDTTMSFTDLGIAADSKLTIAHTDDGTLMIKSGETSLMAKRAGTSADELIATPGSSNAVSFSANVSCTVKFSTRGRWL